MRKLNKYLIAGLLLVGVVQVSQRFVPGVPDFIYGLALGTGIGLELIGIYAMRHDISRLRKYKMTLFRKITGA